MSEKKIAALLLVGASIGLAGGIALHARSAGQATPGAPGTTAISEEEQERLLAKGKQIFVEKCAKCHNERGDKTLSSGKPLSERGLATDVIIKAVSGRLKDRTDEERRAVTLYIASLMKDKDSDKTPPKP